MSLEKPEPGEYSVRAGKTLTELVGNVNASCARGWKIQGGLVISGNGEMYYQAMIWPYQTIGADIRLVPGPVEPAQKSQPLSATSEICAGWWTLTQILCSHNPEWPPRPYNDSMVELVHEEVRRLHSCENALHGFRSAEHSKEFKAKVGSSLQQAKIKLQIYRDEVEGRYVGGVEYTRLIRDIDEAIALVNGL